MQRLPRDVSVVLFRRASGLEFLMLRRTPERRGFWQGVTGAPLAGESDAEAAAREVFEETRLEPSLLYDLNHRYSYRLDPTRKERWLELYGKGVERIFVSSFAVEIPVGFEPTLDPEEHDAYEWCTHEEARERLDWPVERGSVGQRRVALARVVELAGRLSLVPPV